MSVLGDDVDGRPPHDEVAAVLAVHLTDRLAHLALHAVETLVHPHELVLQAQHLLDAGEVEPELGREALDQTQPVEVGFRVETRVAARPLGTDQTLVFVDAKRLGVHADEVGRDGDHVTGPVVHHSPSFRRRSSSSLRRMSMNVTSTPTVPPATRMTAASFMTAAPPSGSRATPSGAPRAPRALSWSASSARSRAAARSGRPCFHPSASARRDRGSATAGRPVCPPAP